MNEEKEFYSVTLTKDGKAIKHEWVYDKEKGEGHYEDVDISYNLYNNLRHYVEIEDGFTLDHLCSLVHNEVEILSIVFRNCWLNDYIEEWKRIYSMNYQPKPQEYDPDGVEYIEVYHHYDMNNGYIDTGEFPSMHGIGWELKEDKWEDYDKEQPVWKKGQRINWGIDFMKMEELLPLPILINEEFKIYKDISDANWSPDNAVDFVAKKKMSLYDVIGAIFWELSFYGGPVDKQEQKEEIDRRYDEVKEALDSGDTSKFLSIDEVLKDLGVEND